jgi:hypothetical protein
MGSTSIELTPVVARTSETGSPTAGSISQQDDALVQNQGSRQEFSLPPVDGGKDAWFFLTACFMLEGLVWG